VKAFAPCIKFSNPNGSCFEGVMVGGRTMY
jgi:hypothetical protein